MTITTNPTRDEYTATAGQTVFNYTFKIFADTDLNVYVTPSGQDCDDSTDLTTSYTVSGVGDASGGSITLTTGASAGDLVTIVSDIPASRTTDYQNNGDFIPDTVNDDFDRVVSLVKQVEDLSNRAILSAECQQGPKPLSFPPPSALQYWRWKSDESGMENVDLAASGAPTTSDLVTYNQGGTGAVDRSVEERLQDVVSVKDFGAVGDGVTDDSAAVQAAVTYFLATSASFGEQYPDSGQIALYFPAGHYDCSASPITITTSNTGQVIFGDGITSQLEDIQINIDDNRCQVHDLLFRGSGTTDGIRVNAAGVDDVRGGSVYNVNIRDKTSGIRIRNNNAHFEFTNVYVEKCQDGLRVDDTLGVQFTNCHFLQNTQYGIYILKAGEVKLDNVTSLGSGDYGLYIVGGTGSQIVECYFNQVTVTGSQATTTNRDTFSITAAADNGAGGTTLTIGAHTLTEGMMGSVISGTTDYNGEHDVFNVTDTTVDIAVAYTSSQTGTFTRPEWDMYILSNSAVGNVNDMFFIGGNINFSRIQAAYNVDFNGTRLKEQCYLSNGSNRIRRSTTGRGRQTDPFKDISISGANTGFSEIISSDPDAASTAAGNGSLLLRVPDNNVATIGNLPQAYNEIRLDEESGVQINTMYSNTSGIIADDGVYSFTPPKATGFMVITNGAGQSARMAQVAFNTATPTMTDGGYVGSLINLTTGVLTGTTGPDGDISISAHTDGKIYIENRNGSNQNMYWTIMR